MITKCYKCHCRDKAYTYIPVLGNIYVCARCYRNWTKWGLTEFKDMINYE